jgi:hypothetical protein
VKYKPNFEKILKSNIGYIYFKNICISLEYFQLIKKNVFAMIRKLGPPTFFIAFTSAEHQWHELVSSFTNLYRNRKNRKHCETLEDKNIDYLIRKDLVTCSHYYRHRINDLKQFICGEKILFGKVSDNYFVTKFQNRGSEREHGLLWIEDAPIYGKYSDSEIVKFLDKYITCDIDHLHQYLAKLYRHSHTRSCKKQKNSHCRYNFPMRPMRMKMILEPIELSDKVVTFTYLEQQLCKERANFLECKHRCTICYECICESIILQFIYE